MNVSAHSYSSNMDCIVPSRSIRTVCAAISALSKIGKDLYVKFDRVNGLILRTLDDAKVSFVKLSLVHRSWNNVPMLPLPVKNNPSH